MGERRRGADLERAILDAAWSELSARGYSGLTMEAVAERAGTSRPVLARRWDGKAPLTVAAIRQEIAKYPMNVPDRGDLRTELLEFLEQASKRAIGIAAVFTLFSSEYFAEAASVPNDLRAAVVQGNGTMLPAILDRAVQRGDIAREKLVPPVDALLGTLFREYVVMNFSAPPPDLRTAWVDRIFLPLVRAS
ncbi:TetR family transcriptional regulator [Mesorhizobium loti]|nr:TetR/AcrR family transcriptional regulator [Mesorhizobium loti]PLP56157.1 TetR family transcriptional regulator [Mesorhizobium loti]